jgi:hypothetical protein
MSSVTIAEFSVWEKNPHPPRRESTIVKVVIALVIEVLIIVYMTNINWKENRYADKMQLFERWQIFGSINIFAFN